MPVHKTKGGYKYGETGKTYKNKKDAIKQALAIAYSKARKKGRKPTQDEIETEIKGNPEAHIDKTAGMTFVNKGCNTMSQKTQEILNNYFIQKEAGLKMKLLRGLVKGKHAAKAAVSGINRGGEEVWRAVKIGAKAPADLAKELGENMTTSAAYRGAAKGMMPEEIVNQLKFRLGKSLENHPKAWGYGTLGAGIAIPTAATVGAVAAAKGGDKGILANTLQLAKDNPLATAGVVGGATGITAASIAYALAPEKTKKLAATIAGLGGLATGVAGTYAGLKA